MVVDVQNGFINNYTKYVPGRIRNLIEREEYAVIFYTRFVNVEGSPFRRMLDWDECAAPPDTEIVPELVRFASEDQIYSKPGYAGLPDNLAERLQREGVEQIGVVGIDTDMCVLKVALDLFDLNIEPLVYIDCCASTAGLQAHLAGLAVLARDIGADHLRDAGLGGGHMAAPPDTE